MSTITEPGFISPTAAAVTSTGGRRPGTWAVVMTTSMSPMKPLSSCLLGRPLVGGQLSGVATGAGRIRDRLELQELGAQRLGLLPGLGADVVRLDLRTQAARGGDGLEAGHADAQDEHVGGLGRAGGRGQEREVAADTPPRR